VLPDDRDVLEDSRTTPLTPRAGAVRGTMGKPRLPRRRAQEHIAPQLRDGPAPRQDTEQLAGHDPNLMAAFQRGVSLAESQQHVRIHHVARPPATDPPPGADAPAGDAG
ncbi:ATP-binding protein, partial [Streptomyces sp. G35A]